MKIAVVISFLISPVLALAFSLDTSDNCIVIYQKETPAFVIPIQSINLEPYHFKVKSKLGSVHYKTKSSDQTSSNITILSPDQIKIKDGEHSGFVQLREDGLFTINSSSKFASFEIKTNPKEIFYGGGVQFSNVELNDHRIVNICEENGIGRGDAPISRWTNLLGVKGEDYSTYYPIPFVVSNFNRGFQIRYPSGLNEIKISEDFIKVASYTQLTNIFLYKKPSMLEVIQAFNELNGRGQPIPNWALGNILGVQGGTMAVKKKIQPLIDKNIPIDAIWIQDWVGKRKTTVGSRLNWQWTLDTSYTDIFDFTKTNNLKTLGYINPFFSEDGHYTREGITHNYFISENELPKLFDFGGMKGYMLNIFKDEAKSWMKGIIAKNLIGNNFDGWMADFAEWYPISSVADIENHNRYTHEWVKLNHEVKKASGKELFIFHRSGTIATAHFSQATWCGDQMTSYGSHDGLPSVINAMISAGVTGLPVLHSDIGGYTSVKKPLIKNYIRDFDLLKDWIKLEAFTPFFRTHEGLLPEDNLQVYTNKEIITLYGKYAKVNQLLIDYFFGCIEVYQKEGTPVIKHPYLMNEPGTPLSFFVGDDIYIQYSEQNKIIPKNFISICTESENDRVHISIRMNSEVYELLKAYI